MPDKSITSFLHSGDMGDIVAGLGAVSEFCAKQRTRARILLDTNGGWQNPFCVRDSRGLGMKFDRRAADFLAPLIRAQPFVASCEVWDGKEKADIDLNAFRNGFRRPFVLETCRNLLYCHQQALGLKMGWHGAWLAWPNGRDGFVRDALVARSNRYHSSDQIYRKNTEAIKAGGFVGTDLEYAAFEDCTRIKPERVPVADAEGLAREIAASRTFFCNGTLAYWIAVGIGHQHIVHEVGVGIPTTVFRPFSVPGIEYAQGNGLRAISDLQ